MQLYITKSIQTLFLKSHGKTRNQIICFTMLVYMSFTFGKKNHGVPLNHLRMTVVYMLKLCYQQVCKS